MNDTDVKEASRGAIRKMNRLGKEQMYDVNFRKIISDSLGVKF